MRRSWYLALWAFVSIASTIFFSILASAADVIGRSFATAFPAPTAGLHRSGFPSLISTETLRRSLGSVQRLIYTIRLVARTFVGRGSGDVHRSSSAAIFA
jgi:hypothetical protein